MESGLPNQAFLTSLVDMLEAQFGVNCEIVLHDLTKDYNHTIVDIRNGHITNRKIGGSGTNLGLEVLSGNVQGDGNKYNYVVHTKSGKVLRSSSMYFRNEQGEVIGSLCINQDITDSLRFAEYLDAFNNYPLQDRGNGSSSTGTIEVFVDNVSQLLDYLVLEGVSLVGKEISEMNRTDKIQFLGFLESKGAFQISKSSDQICELLSISKFTLYNYLDQARTME